MRMLVSKTETGISWSKWTFSMTRLTPLSNSGRSPRTTSVVKESTRVKEKLRERNYWLWIGDLEKEVLLSQGIVNISSVWFNSAYPTAAAQRHQFICRKCIFHVCVVSMIKHIPGFISESGNESSHDNLDSKSKSFLPELCLEGPRKISLTSIGQSQRQSDKEYLLPIHCDKIKSYHKMKPMIRRGKCKFKTSFIALPFMINPF